ncbi:hypothetical protein [Salinicola sp. CR57]|uniref:hypothetical protein n=1 Tax=Salinicola sp. CR57 TaxID=1949086 RepID=UPI000DA1DF2E|nr:hypothetical protein [Salinicola sp. CR57]
MTILTFPQHNRVDLMQLTLGVLGNGPASAEDISEILAKKGYHGFSAEGVEQAIDGLRRNGYSVETDGQAYWLGDGGAAA